MGELGQQARETLAAYRARTVPSPEVADRSWDRISERIDNGEAPLDVNDLQRPCRRPYRIGAAMAVAAVAVLAIGVDMASGLQRARDPVGTTAYGAGATARPAEKRDATRRTVQRPRATLPTDVTPAAAPAVENRAIDGDPEPVTSRRTRAHRRALPAGRAPAAGPDAGTIRAEARLIGRARAALRDGDVSGVLALVDEHTRQFAGGELVEEREVLRISATCELGRTKQARALAQKFLARRAGSPLAAHVRRICQDSGRNTAQ